MTKSFEKFTNVKMFLKDRLPKKNIFHNINLKLSFIIQILNLTFSGSGKMWFRFFLSFSIIVCSQNVYAMLWQLLSQ